MGLLRFRGYFESVQFVRLLLVINWLIRGKYNVLVVVTNLMAYHGVKHKYRINLLIPWLISEMIWCQGYFFEEIFELFWSSVYESQMKLEMACEILVRNAFRYFAWDIIYSLYHRSDRCNLCRKYFITIAFKITVLRSIYKLMLLTT